MKTVFKVFVGVCLAGLVFIVGCALLIGSAAEDVSDEAQEHAITRAEFDAVQQGTSQADVEKKLGDPDDSQEFEQRFGGQTQGSSCIYYNEKGKELFEGDSYQFCFTNGKLDSKNVW